MDRYVYTFLNSFDIFSSTFPFFNTDSKNKSSSLVWPQPPSTLWSSLPKQCPSRLTLTLSSSSSKSDLPFLHPWLPLQASVLPHFFRRHLLNSTSMRRHPPSSFAPPSSYTSHPTQPKSNTSHAFHARSVLTSFKNDKFRCPHQWRWRLD
jgi:hypothetical protein